MEIKFVAPGFSLMLNVLKAMLKEYPNISLVYISEQDKHNYSHPNLDDHIYADYTIPDKECMVIDTMTKDVKTIPVVAVKELDNADTIIGIDGETIIIGVMSP